jgi:hypothetical protein
MKFTLGFSTLYTNHMVMAIVSLDCCKKKLKIVECKRCKLGMGRLVDC